jgi:ribonuclease P/MRP protein subunit RPP40
MRNDLKCNEQCKKAVHKANKTFGMIKRSFSILTKGVFLPLYKSLVRPHLEYCLQA